MNFLRLITILLILGLPLQILAQDKPTEKEELYTSIFLSQSVEPQAQDWEKEPPIFPSGYYYQFNGISIVGVAQEVTRPDLVLGYLIGQGIIIEDAWYRQRSTYCGFSEVIVGSSLAIRTESDKHNDLLKRYGFIKVERPLASCPSAVTHYSFNRKK
jgi:hypothetical protein